MIDTLTAGPYSRWPAPVAPELDHDAMRRLRELWTRRRGLKAVFELGSADNPGLSELRFLFVFAPGARVDASLLRGDAFPPEIREHVAEGHIGCVESAWPDRRAWLRPLPLTQVFGSPLPEGDLGPDETPGVALGLLVDYLTFSAPVAWISEARRKPTDVRSLLSSLDELKFILPLAKQAGISSSADADELGHRIERLRADWFSGEQPQQLAQLRDALTQALRVIGSLANAADALLLESAGHLPNMQGWTAAGVPCLFQDEWDFEKAQSSAADRLAAGEDAVWTVPASFLHVLGLYGSQAKDMAVHLWQMGIWLPESWDGGRRAPGLRRHARAMVEFGAGAASAGIAADREIALGFRPMPTRAERALRALKTLVAGRNDEPGTRGRMTAGFSQRSAEARRKEAHLSAVDRSLAVNEEKLRKLADSGPLVLVGLVEHFGDIVACEPVARYLRRAHPEAGLAWCVRRPFRELIDSHPDIDTTVVVECLSEWIRIASTLENATIVDLHVNGRVCPTCLVPLIKTGTGSEITASTYYNHGTLLQAFGRSAGLPPLSDAPRVCIGPAHVAAVDRLNLPPRYVVVHPMSNESSRQWRKEGWDRLAAELYADRGLTTVEIGLQPILDAAPHVVSLCGKLSLLETAEVIRKAALFVGIDSGPAHLANAVSTPGVLLFGRYRDFGDYLPYTGPYADGKTATIIRHTGVPSDLPYEPVRDAILARLQSNNGESRSQPSSLQESLI